MGWTVRVLASEAFANLAAGGPRSLLIASIVAVLLFAVGSVECGRRVTPQACIASGSVTAKRHT